MLPSAQPPDLDLSLLNFKPFLSRLIFLFSPGVTVGPFVHSKDHEINDTFHECVTLVSLCYFYLTFLQLFLSSSVVAVAHLLSQCLTG